MNDEPDENLEALLALEGAKEAAWSNSDGGLTSEEWAFAIVKRIPPALYADVLQLTLVDWIEASWKRQMRARVDEKRRG